jgi:hypothetical protein
VCPTAKKYLQRFFLFAFVLKIILAATGYILLWLPFHTLATEAPTSRLAGRNNDNESGPDEFRKLHFHELCMPEVADAIHETLSYFLGERPYCALAFYNENAVTTSNVTHVAV